jgi:glutamate-1-semialdehyde 2,1-aminomutase
MFQIFFTNQSVYDTTTAKTSNTAMFRAYFRVLLMQGVFIPPAQFETCFLSTAHTETDTENTVNAFDKALKAASKVGENSA